MLNIIYFIILLIKLYFLLLILFILTAVNLMLTSSITKLILEMPNVDYKSQIILISNFIKLSLKISTVKFSIVIVLFILMCTIVLLAMFVLAFVVIKLVIFYIEGRGLCNNCLYNSKWNKVTVGKPSLYYYFTIYFCKNCGYKTLTENNKKHRYNM